MTDHASLALALVAALADMTDVPTPHTAEVKTAKGSYSYRYAGLPDVHAITRPALALHGLAVMQDVVVDDDGVGVSTHLVHSSGEWRAFGPVRFRTDGSPQASGSAITYARRYGLCAALGIAADSDDDGKAAQESAPPERTQRKPRRKAPAAVDPQAIALEAWIAKLARLPKDSETLREIQADLKPLTQGKPLDELRPARIKLVLAALEARQAEIDATLGDSTAEPWPEPDPADPQQRKFTDDPLPEELDPNAGDEAG